MLAIELMSPKEIASQIADNVRTLRLRQNLSQEGLAERSGMSLGSLKRFEQTGAISFESLIRLSIALGATKELTSLFQPPEITDIDDIIKAKPAARARGREK
ncbi:helix-turn-helix domain-containing protein [Magnetovibrio blakemorei]|uniref:HTH cro/C1-type domain-containing protein n=1 Tax=Magnetovibrio blakemorei TaxID=28181 RepID=A0A1E5Q5R7_9PROT|nr:helix-turn-helix transcriptional regulator [Magnetovibrio blakemorei]OEJ65524.1 hypothetical protein BEN30_14175 [Magnetovibrio blakemorei]